MNRNRPGSKPDFRPDFKAGFQEGSKAAPFLELAQPDSLGFSRPVPVTEFTDMYDRLQFGNGGDWVRKDGFLAKRYNIRRHPEGTAKSPTSNSRVSKR